MNKYRFAATGYIIHDNKVLLIKHPKLGVWLPVGGKVDVGEHPEDSFIREVKEEVGLSVEIIKTFEHPRVVGGHRYLQLEKVGDGYHLDFIYYAKANSKKLVLNEKVREARWLSFSEFLQDKKMFFEDVVIELEKIYARYCDYDPFQIVRAEHNNVGQIFDKAFVVNHSDEKTDYFLREVNRYAKKTFYVEKEYSGNKISKEKITNFVGKQNVVNVKNALKILETSDANDVVFDMSGLISEKIYQNLNWRGFSIEDTANGLNWLKGGKKISKPIFSIAYSRLKKSVENPKVAESIFSSLLNYCYKNDRNIYGINILMIGYGSIGSILVEMLSLITENVVVYDIDYSQILRAKANRFKVIDSLENISCFDMVISSTGTPAALGEKELRVLKNGAMLINCSTKQWEFDRDFINRQERRIVGDTEFITIEDRQIELFNSGFPINFWNSGGTHSSAILSTFACILESAVHIEKRRDIFLKAHPRVYEVSEILPKIEDKYLKYYFLKNS